MVTEPARAGGPRSEDEDSVPAGGWRRAYLQAVLTLKGATAREVYDEITAQDFYPEYHLVRINLHQMAALGVLRKGEKKPCDECGHPHTRFFITEAGRVLLLAKAAA